MKNSQINIKCFDVSQSGEEAMSVYRPRHFRLAACALLFAAMSLPGVVQAQEVVCTNMPADGFPCSIQLDAVSLQKVPTVLKFQSRVAQAKLPIGSGLFTAVYVNVRVGNETRCSEQFTNVQVKDSTLNLEIGRQMNCELDAVLAENSDVKFQICLGSQSNCLKPISFGATPFAVKANYAVLAQNAHRANEAMTSHYAYRASADRDTVIRQTIGTGYFDFYTQPASSASSIYSASEYSDYEDGGFLAWTPIRDRAAKNFHILAKSHGSDSFEYLDTLVLGANATETRGPLTVFGDESTDYPLSNAHDYGVLVTSKGGHFIGDSKVTGQLTVTSVTQVEGDLRVGSGGTGKFVVSADTGNTQIDANLEVDGTAGFDGDFRVGAEPSSQFSIEGATGRVTTLAPMTVTGGIDSDLRVGAGGANKVTIDAETGNLVVVGTITTEGGIIDEGLNTTLANINAAIGTNETNIAANASDISDHADTLSDHADDLASHQGLLDSHAGTLSSHAGTLSSHTNSLNTHWSHISSHQGSLNSHSSSISTNTSRISGLYNYFTDSQCTWSFGQCMPPTDGNNDMATAAAIDCPGNKWVKSIKVGLCDFNVNIGGFIGNISGIGQRLEARCCQPKISY